MSGAGCIKKKSEERKRMKSYLKYGMERKETLAEVFLFMVMMGAAANVLVPYTITRFSNEETMGVFHILLGSVLAGGGILIFLPVLKRWRTKEKWKKNLGWDVVWYLAVEALSANLIGIAGQRLYIAGKGSVLEIEQKMELFTGIWQNGIRAVFLLLLVEQYYGRSIRQDYRKRQGGLGIFFCYSVWTWAGESIKKGWRGCIENTLAEAVIILVYLIYYGEKAKNADITYDNEK